MFDRSILRSGDFLEFDDGVVYVFIDTFGSGIGQNGRYHDFSKTIFSNYTVVHVYRPHCLEDACFNDYRLGDLIYSKERDEATEMTLSEVCKA